MIKVAAVIGSPRNNGETYKNVQKFELRLKKLDENIDFSYIFLKDAHIEQCFESMFSPLHLSPDAGVGIGLLLLPTAIQEMVFAVWLIMKGFNPSAIASGSGQQRSNKEE